MNLKMLIISGPQNLKAIFIASFIVIYVVSFFNNEHVLLIIIKQSRELGASLVAQLVKNPPAMQETLVQSLSWEDPWKRKWQPTPVFLPGKFHGRKSLAGYIQSMKWWRVGHELTTSLSLSKRTAAIEEYYQSRKLFRIYCCEQRFGYIKHHTLVCVVNTEKGGRIKAWLWSSPCGEIISSVQLLRRAWLFVTPGTAALQASLSITNSKHLLKLKRIKSVMPSSHLILCCPLLLLPPILPSIRVFSKESTLHMRWPKYWSFSFSISPSNERPGLISFRMDWLDLLSAQGTLNSLLQHHTSKA